MKSLGLCLLAEWTFVAFMSRHGDFLQKGEAARFAGFGIVAGLAFWLAAGRFTRLNLPKGKKKLVFWLVAVAIQATMLPTSPTDDLWRYRWEGKIQLHGFNPYQLSPDAPVLTSLRDADWLKINHQDFSAIYPPLAEMGFAGLAAGGGSVLGYKVLFMLANLGVAGILRQLLGSRGISPDAASWYAWNPLAAYVSSGAAHFDAAMLLPLIGAIWCLDRIDARPLSAASDAWRVPPLAWASTLLLGLSIAVKIVPAVLLPVWFFALGWRRAVLTLPVAVGMLPALAWSYGFPQVPVFAALGDFARGFRVNDSVWWLLDTLFRGGAATGISRAEQTAAALICGALAVWFRRDWRRGLLWVLGAALLLGPALHAWYVVWVLPLAAWRGQTARPWFVLSISVFGYFLLWEFNRASGKPWQEPLWLRLFIYLPPLFALGWTTAQAARKRPAGMQNT